jgi:Holliday junction resolvase RusA-like endonuclease
MVDLLPKQNVDLLDQMVIVVMEGDPRGKGRPRFAARGSFVQVYTDPQTSAYEQLIQEEVLRMIGGQQRVVMLDASRHRAPIKTTAEFRFVGHWSCPKNEKGACWSARRPVIIA